MSTHPEHTRASLCLCIPTTLFRLQCVDHKPKNFIQKLAAASSSEHVLDVDAIYVICAELAEEDPNKYGALVAALKKKNDMQSTAALVYVLVCRKLHERLLRKGLLREYAILYTLGMAYMAYVMPGLNKLERTRRIELIQALLVYNLYGDRMYLPFGTVSGDARGIRAEKMGGIPATNLLAFLANADARARFRAQFPEAWQDVNETMYSQKDVRTLILEPTTRQAPTAENYSEGGCWVSCPIANCVHYRLRTTFPSWRNRWATSHPSAWLRRVHDVLTGRTMRSTKLGQTAAMHSRVLGKSGALSVTVALVRPTGGFNMSCVFCMFSMFSMFTSSTIK